MKIEDLRPDVVLLDVQMPGLDGFEVVRALGSAHRPAIIFVTAFDQYAVRAFEVSATDYLMKPVTAERLAQALAKARSSPSDVEDLLEAIRTSQPKWLQRLVGRKANRYHVISIGGVHYFQAEEKLVFAVASSGRYVLKQALRDLELQLDPERFARVHRQTILNLTDIAEIEPLLNGGAIARLRSGQCVEISRRHSSALREKLHW